MPIKFHFDCWALCELRAWTDDKGLVSDWGLSEIRIHGFFPYSAKSDDYSRYAWISLAHIEADSMDEMENKIADAAKLHFQGYGKVVTR